MKTKLLRKIRREARNIFYNKISRFGTTNGEVTLLRYDASYEWAVGWVFGEQLDYHEDRDKIVCKIARLLWKREKRKFWYSKLRPAGKGGRNDRRQIDKGRC